jgi:hypothetical protein
MRGRARRWVRLAGRPLAALPLLLAAIGCSGASDETGAVRKTRRGSGEECESAVCRLEALARDEPERTGSRWQIELTPSFRIFHFDATSAASVGQAAEAIRTRQLREWLGAPPKEAWSPRCDIYLFPTTRLLVQMSGRDAKAGSASAQHSQLTRGRMLTRRLNLAGDDQQLLRATLPHEISHVIVTELLEGKRVPLWAHEGLAVLAELSDVSRSRYAEVVEDYLARKQTFSVSALLDMSRYPDQEFTALYYAQSVSLTQFFLARGGRVLFLRFLRAAAAGSPEAAIRQHYAIDGLLELQRLWLAYAASR